MRPSFLTLIAGERKLPGARVAPLALLLALVACSSPAATPSTSSSGAAQSAAASTSAPATTQAAIPTLGGPAASGVVLPTYFVTILESRYGTLGVLTTPGSACTGEAAMPDGTTSPSSELRTPRTADSSGRLAFNYPTPPAAPGVGTHTVSCELAGQRGQARARFDVK